MNNERTEYCRRYQNMLLTCLVLFMIISFSGSTINWLFEAFKNIDMTWFYPCHLTIYKNYMLPSDTWLAKMVTVVTTTNPRPSHPSTGIISETILSTYIDPSMYGVRHIIAADGCPTEEAMHHKSWNHKWDASHENCPKFKQFVRNMFTAMHNSSMERINIEMIVQPEAIGLGKNLKRVMDFLQTPYVFVQQDDMPMARNYNMTGLILTMEADPNIRYVRFGRPIPPGWDHNLTAYEHSGKYGVDLVFHGYVADHNHVVRADYYRECLSILNDKDYDFGVFEDLRKYSKDCDDYGYLYGSIEDYSPMTFEKAYIKHFDGRNAAKLDRFYPQS